MPSRVPEPVETEPNDVRGRLIRAAAELLASGGRDAVSTRAVSAAAGVQTPTIYRQFGDMQGLLEAVAHVAFAAYMDEKAASARTHDPVADLRRGWDRHVAFGLTHPAAYVLIFGDPTTAASTAARDGEAHLETLVARVAEAGRLRVGVRHAARLIAAAGHGVTLALLAAPPDERDPRLSDAMREAVLAGVTVALPSEAAAAALDAMTGPARVAARAVALDAVLADAADVLSPAERRLLGEWLNRLAGGA